MDVVAPRLGSWSSFRRLLVIPIVAALLVAGLLALAGAIADDTATAQSNTGTADYFLRIDGLPGESTDAAHRDQIELLAYEWSHDGQPGLERPDTGGGGGGGAARAQADAIHFTQNVSKASPLLMLAVADARQFREATLFVRKGGANPQEYVTIKLSDVTVSSYRTAAQSPAGPTDEFTLTFGKVEYAYTPQNPDGSSAPAVVGSWDFTTNTGG